MLVDFYTICTHAHVCRGTCAQTEQLIYRNVDDVKDNFDDVKTMLYSPF